MNLINKYYVARVKTMQEFETNRGDIKYKTHVQTYLVHADSVTQAQKNVKQFVTSIYDDFEVVSVNESRIIAVIQDLKDIIQHKQ